MAQAKDRNREGGRHLDRLFEMGTLSGLSDEHLLERFTSCRDELAFGDRPRRQDCRRRPVD
jgi:hypothetical protein